jgi:hypothetical protein
VLGHGGAGVVLGRGEPDHLPGFAAFQISEARACGLLGRGAGARLPAVAGGDVGGPVLCDRSLGRGARGVQVLPHGGHVACAGIAHFKRPPNRRRRFHSELQRRAHGRGLAWTVMLASRERLCWATSQRRIASWSLTAGGRGPAP